MHLPTDADVAALLAAAQHLDEGAFDTLYTLYAEPIFHFFRSRISDYHTAEDLTSTVFARVVEALPRFRVPATGQGRALTTWMFRIAHNQLTDHYRRTAYPAVPLDERLPSSDLPAVTVERCLDAQALRAALTQLTREQQSVVVLRFVEELSLEEVASITGRPVGAVKSMQHRALRSLAHLLEKLNAFPER